MNTRATLNSIASTAQALAVTSNEDGSKRELGQFFTPLHVAELMASMFYARTSEINVLDAGAGTGALARAFVRRLCNQEDRPAKISVTAFELDSALIDSLESTLKSCEEDCGRVGIAFSAQVRNEDFIAWAASVLLHELFSEKDFPFNAAIVNPPYRKLRNETKARRLLRSVGIETTNLYSAFVALILRLLSNGGEVVAITPRSFCNGTYFRSFRRELLETSALNRVHVFESRSAAFAKDGVLQENLIIHAIKGEPKPQEVSISLSNGSPNSSTEHRKTPYSEVVIAGDPEQFIRISVNDLQTESAALARNFRTALTDLGLSVSTGRVVDFRSKDFVRLEPTNDSVPLIYPSHFKHGFVSWPGNNTRKPNAIVMHEMTSELLVPAGFYVLVKRFSSKEERKRIVACVYDPNRISAQFVGFENHVNYFHIAGRGMPSAMAKGLAVFLNSMLLDRYFRQFSGHTQVNAGDLRNVKYPSYEQLRAIGDQIADDFPDQARVDELIEGLLNTSRIERAEDSRLVPGNTARAKSSAL